MVRDRVCPVPLFIRYKLMYFHARGVVENIRIMFYLGSTQIVFVCLCVYVGFFGHTSDSCVLRNFSPLLRFFCLKLEFSSLTSASQSAALRLLGQSTKKLPGCVGVDTKQNACTCNTYDMTWSHGYPFVLEQLSKLNDARFSFLQPFYLAALCRLGTN